MYRIEWWYMTQWSDEYSVQFHNQIIVPCIQANINSSNNAGTIWLYDHKINVQNALLICIWCNCIWNVHKWFEFYFNAGFWIQNIHNSKVSPSKYFNLPLQPAYFSWQKSQSNSSFHHLMTYLDIFHLNYNFQNVWKFIRFQSIWWMKCEN